MILFKTIISFLKDSSYRNLLITSIIVLAIGTLSYSYLEGWSFIDSLYFSVITLTTIGYGDLSPQTVEGKLFTIFYIFIGIGIILSFINTVYEHYNNSKKTKSS
jgi:voltage-gated potassium channel Kch